MPQIILDNIKVNYDIHRSKRSKSVTIVVSPVSGVTVRMPLRLTRYINPEDILTKNKNWLLKKIANLKVIPPETPLNVGSKFFYLGREITIDIYHDINLQKPTLLFFNDSLIFKLNTSEYEKIDIDFKSNVKLFLKNSAKQIIPEVVQKYATKMQLNYKKIFIRDQKTKWGSCSESGNLNFNWRLAMMPLVVIEYLAIHELAHLVHFNHSKDFWQLVEKFSPNYKQHEKWLKNEGLQITSTLL